MTVVNCDRQKRRDRFLFHSDTVRLLISLGDLASGIRIPRRKTRFVQDSDRFVKPATLGRHESSESSVSDERRVHHDITAVEQTACRMRTFCDGDASDSATLRGIQTSPKRERGISGQKRLER